MNDSHYGFLKTLVETASPPGAEDEAARLWRDYVQPYATSLSGDSQGNSIALINPEGSPRVQLAGHLDEISLIVRYVDSDGFLYFDAAGGFDPLTIIGGRFHLLGPQGKILGVIGRKARHLQSGDEHRRGVEIDDLWLDIGAKDRAEAETAAPIGTYAVRAATFERLGTGSLVASRALDNKAGAYAIARALELLSKRAVAAAVYAVATVQEEVGLRGARVSAFGIDPSVAIAVDVTHASDYPTADKRRVGDIKVGGGPVVTFGPTVSAHVSALILRAANAAGIAVQREAVGRNTATDADAIQQVRAGIATGLVSIPLRYMHTGVEVASLDDIEKTAELLAAAVEHLGPRMSFVR